MLTKAEANALTDSSPDTVHIGRYGEPRLIYTDAAFFTDYQPLAERRTIHLGVDLFAPAGTPVCAPLRGVVVAIEHFNTPLDFGGWWYWNTRHLTEIVFIPFTGISIRSALIISGQAQQ